MMEAAGWRAKSRDERYCPRKYRVRTIATEAAAGAPASPDVSRPVQLSGASVTTGAGNPALPAKIVIKPPQIAPAPRAEGTRRGLVATPRVPVQAGRGFIVRAGCGRYTRGCLSAEGGFQCRFKWFCCRSSC